jgi:hypothetical protein
VEDGKPTPIPQLVPETEKEYSRYFQALARRRWRMERKVLFEDIEMNKLPSLHRLDKTYKKLVKLSTSSEDWELMHENDGLRVWFKDAPVMSISEERMCCMKGEITVSASCEEVHKLVVNLQKRPEWDILLSHANVVENINESAGIFHMVGETIDKSGKRISIDFCILQYLHTIPPEDGVAYVISERSIKHPQVPKRDDCVRGQVFAPSGFVISSEHGSDGAVKTKVVYTIRQLGNEALGANMVSQWEAFIESLLSLRKCINNAS